MVTLSQCYLELRARRARLTEAVISGWRDCVPSERETVREFEDAFMQLLLQDGGLCERLMQLAGGVELGALPAGLSLAYSAGYDDEAVDVAETEGIRL